MRRSPLVLLIGAVLVVIAAILGFTYPKWSGSPATEQAAAPAAPAQETTAAAQPETTAAAQPETTAAAQSTDASAQSGNAAQPAAPELAKPTFDIVRVDADGSAVVAGRGQPTADVTVTISGNPLGAAKVTEQGEWVVMSGAPLAPGSYELKAVAALDGNQAVSDESVALVVPERNTDQKPLAVVSAPNEPSTVLAQAVPAAAQVGELMVTLDAIDYNDKGDILFSGKGPTGHDVRLYSDNAPIGFAAISPEGKWTFTSRDLIQPGEHKLRVDAVDQTGKVIARIELPFTRTAPETAAEAAAQPKDGRVIIQPGNNLWRISRVIYGDGDRYTVIYEANKDQIRDPNLIYPGQILATPGVVPPEKIDPDSREPLATTTAQ